jgi:hypothetical protein
VDTARGVLLVEPGLPPWLNEVTIRGLEVLGQRASLTVRRDGDGYAVAADGPIQDADRGGRRGRRGRTAA